MPLTYDDIDGSWGVYSKDWPNHDFETDEAIKQARRLIVQHKLVPYGCYVTMGTVLRCETQAQVQRVRDAVETVKGHVVNDVSQYTTDKAALKYCRRKKP